MAKKVASTIAARCGTYPLSQWGHAKTPLDVEGGTIRAPALDATNPLYLLFPRRGRSRPSLRHVTWGMGHPSAWHGSTTEPFASTFTSSGPGWISGATETGLRGWKTSTQTSTGAWAPSNPITLTTKHPIMLHIPELTEMEMALSSKAPWHSSTHREPPRGHAG